MDAQQGGTPTTLSANVQAASALRASHPVAASTSVTDSTVPTELAENVVRPSPTPLGSNGEVHLEWVDKLHIELFTDEFGAAWARVRAQDHYETLRLGSKAFRNWLMRSLLLQGESPSQRNLRERIAVLEALADGEQRELANRSAWTLGKKELWLDLCDSKWRGVRIDGDGWSVVPHPRAMFRHFAHQQPLPDPEHGGSFDELWKFLPRLSSTDKLLLQPWIVTALVPMPRPILAVIGPHGSGKSTLSLLVRRLLDPSRVELLGRDARADLPQVFFKHAVPVFDNTDGMTPAEADLCCQACTGRGIARRKLYTDGDEFIFSFQRAIIINGMALPTNPCTSVLSWALNQKK